MADEALLPHLAEDGTAFLAKPFDRDALAAAARSLLAGAAEDARTA